MLDITIRPFDEEAPNVINDDLFVVEVKAGEEFLEAAENIKRGMSKAIDKFFAKRSTGNVFCAPSSDFNGGELEVFEYDPEGISTFFWNNISVTMYTTDVGVNLTLYCPKQNEGDDYLDGTKRWGCELPSSFWIHPAYTIRKLFGIGDSK